MPKPQTLKCITYLPRLQVPRFRTTCASNSPLRIILIVCENLLTRGPCLQGFFGESMNLLKLCIKSSVYLHLPVGPPLSPYSPKGQNPKKGQVSSGALARAFFFLSLSFTTSEKNHYSIFSSPSHNSSNKSYISTSLET